MVNLTRRRTLCDMEFAEQWDVEWDYTKGLMKDNGFSRTTSGSGYTDQITSTAERINSGTGYVMLKAPKLKSTSAIAEYEFSYTSYAVNNNGLRFILSNGSNGVQVFAYKSSNHDVPHLWCQEGSTASNKVDIGAIALNTRYKLRIEFNNNGINKIYLDGVELRSTTNKSQSYCTENRIFAQATSTYHPEANFYSVKYKWNPF